MERVKFRVLKRKRIICLEIDPSQSVKNIKEMVASMLKWDCQGISLILNGKVLSNEEIFAEFFRSIKLYIYVYYEFTSNLESVKSRYVNEAKAAIEKLKAKIETNNNSMIDLFIKTLKIGKELIRSSERMEEEVASSREISKLLDKDYEELKVSLDEMSQFK